MNCDSTILYFILPVLSISMLLIFIRLYKGPSLMDKVIALDLLVTVTIGSFAGYGIYHDEVIIVDIALIVAILSFLSTVAFTYYYEKGNYQVNKKKPKNQDDKNKTNETSMNEQNNEEKSKS